MNRTNAKDFSQLSNYETEYTPGAGRYNVGQSSHLLTMPMLKASLTQVLTWRPDNIQAYCKKLKTPLVDYLKGLNVKFENDTYLSNHLFALRLPSSIDMTAINHSLAEHKVKLSLRGTALRVSVNVFNDERDIQKLIDVIEMNN